MSIYGRISRRRFLAASAAAAAPAFVPASALGAEGKGGKAAASSRIVIGMIGFGNRARANARSLMAEADAQIVAVCDVDKNHLAEGIDVINKGQESSGCRGYGDFRELLGRDDLDAVVISTPDNWHGYCAVAAANRGLDIYCEKPLAHTLAEQQAIVAAVQKNKRIWQTGSWQRSQWNFRKGVELVLNGHIGKLKRVEVGLPDGHRQNPEPELVFTASPPPPELNYDMWIGPSRMEPYIPARVHRNWRWNYNVGGGQLMDWIGHHCDIAHWGMGMDDSGPLEITPVQVDFPAADAVWNTATRYRFTCRYPRNIELVVAGGHEDIARGTKFIGEDGWVYVDRPKFEASNPAWTKNDFDPGPVKLYVSPGHERNWLDSIRSRKPTLTPVEVAHRSATPGHLGHIAMRLGRPIRWDPKKEVIVNDSEASAMLGTQMREPWTL